MAYRADLVKPLHNEILQRIVSRHPTFDLKSEDIENYGFIVYASNYDWFTFLRNRLRCNPLFRDKVEDAWTIHGGKRVEHDNFVLEIIGDILLKYKVKEISFNYELDSSDDKQRTDWIYYNNKWEVLKNY